MDQKITAAFARGRQDPQFSVAWEERLLYCQLQLLKLQTSHTEAEREALLPEMRLQELHRTMDCQALESGTDGSATSPVTFGKSRCPSHC